MELTFVVEIEQDHGRFRGTKDHISEFFNLHRRLEWELKFRGTNGDVWEIEKVYFQRIEQTLTSDDQLLGLFFNRKRADESSDLFSCLPFGQLTKTLLASPYASMNNLQEELSSPRIEDEDSSIDGLGRQVTLECLVDGHAIDIGIVYE